MIMKKLFFLPFFLLLLSYHSTLTGAGPITHAFLAERWLELEEHYHSTFFTSKQKSSFLLGCFFPDIQYLGGVRRDQTHFFNVSLEQIHSEKNPFTAGMYHHCMVDEIREAFVIKKDMYHYLMHMWAIPEEKITTFLKLLEEQILFRSVKKEYISNILLHIDNEEKRFGSDNKILIHWHLGLLMSFGNTPKKMIKTANLLGVCFWGVRKEIIEEWSYCFDEVVNDPYILQYVEQLVEMFDNYFINYLKISKKDRSSLLSNFFR